MRHNILGYSHCVVKVHDSMPPPSRNENSLPRLLDALNHLNLFEVLVLSDLRQYFREVIDGFIHITLATILLALDN
jgi:hypothetical protein